MVFVLVFAYVFDTYSAGEARGWRRRQHRNDLEQKHALMAADEIPVLSLPRISLFICKIYDPAFLR